MGTPGPDQGYALKLVSRFRNRLTLRDGESEADALAGGSAVAMKRSGRFGRAPVIHDLTVGLTVWGFLDPEPPRELVHIRGPWFDGVHLAQHYDRLRRIADAVTDEVLGRTHDQVSELHAADWRQCLDLTV